MTLSKSLDPNQSTLNMHTIKISKVAEDVVVEMCILNSKRNAKICFS